MTVKRDPVIGSLRSVEWVDANPKPLYLGVSDVMAIFSEEDK